MAKLVSLLFAIFLGTLLHFSELNSAAPGALDDDGSLIGNDTPMLAQVDTQPNSLHSDDSDVDHRLVEVLRSKRQDNGTDEDGPRFWQLVNLGGTKPAGGKAPNGPANGPDDTQGSGNHMWIIIAVVVGVVLLIACVVIYCCCCGGKTSKSKSKSSSKNKRSKKKK